MQHKSDVIGYFLNKDTLIPEIKAMNNEIKDIHKEKLIFISNQVNKRSLCINSEIMTLAVAEMKAVYFWIT